MSDVKSQPSFIAENRLMMHALIMVMIITVIWHLEPFGSLTPLGMRLLGIFAAVLYGWTTCDLFWPSLIGIIALPFSGVFTSLSAFLQISFGNETIVFLLFMFGFTEIMNESGLVDCIANKMISFKMLNNRPWIFSALLLLAAYIIAFINMFAAILIPSSILYAICERFAFKPYEKYPTLMLLGITIASVMGGSVMPYQPVPLIVMKTYSQITGLEANFFKHILFILPVTFCIIILYILICRFIFRPDIKGLKDISNEFANKEVLTLNLRQKIIIAFFLFFVFLMIAPNILPQNLAVTQIISTLGIAGCTFLLIILMTIISVQGKPLMDFDKLSSRSLHWGVFVTLSFVIPFAGIFTSDATGVKPFILQVVKPILVGLPPVLFIIVVMLLAVVFTNFMNNMVIGAIFTTVIFALASEFGLETMPLVAVLILCVNLSFVTPAACPNTAMLFANRHWCKAGMLYKYGLLSVLLLFIFAVLIGLFWANIVY